MLLYIKNLDELYTLENALHSHIRRLNTEMSSPIYFCDNETYNEYQKTRKLIEKIAIERYYYETK